MSQLHNQCTVSSDCARLPIDARTCGGLGDDIIYSGLNAYADYIQTLAPLKSKLEEECKKGNSVGLVCSIVGEPTLLSSKNTRARTSFLDAIVYPFGWSSFLSCRYNFKNSCK